MKTIIRGGTIIPVDPESRIYPAADLYIDGGKILAVAPESPPFEAAAADSLVEAAGCLVLPGFINAHGHLALGIYRGLGEFAPGQAWEDHFRRQAALTPHLTDEDYYLAAELLIAEMLRAGITSFADIHFEPPGSPPVTDLIAQAVEAAGIRAVLSLEANGYLSSGGVRLKHDPAERDRSLAASLAFAEKWNGAASGRITVMIGLANPPAPMPDDLEALARAAAKTGLSIQMHIAEIAQEMAEWHEIYGERPAQVMDRYGLLDHHILGGNVVFLTKQDAEFLRSFPFHASTCPKNCSKIALGMLDIPAMLDAGLNVCLGTNEVVNNNRLDMIEEMRFAALHHKMKYADPRILTGDEPLRLITERGGRALGTGAGTLAPGRPADVVVLAAGGPHMQPAHDPIANLIFSAAAADVRDVMVAGRWMMRDRQLLTIDEAAASERLENRLAPLRELLPALEPGSHIGPFALSWKVERG